MRSIGQMFPGLSSGNTAYLRPRNFEVARDFRVGNSVISKASDLANLICRDFCAGMILSVIRRITAPPLFSHISHVIHERPQEQMVGIDAWRIIAFVADVKPVRDRAVVNFPRSAVRQVTTKARSILPVSRPVDRSLPLPALVGISGRGVLPKARFHGSVAQRVPHAVFGGLALYLPKRNVISRVYQGGLPASAGAQRCIFHDA